MFYVYKKFRPDGTLCYIGKGHGGRYRDRGNRNPDLRALIDAGGVVTKIVKRGLTETAALHLERSMIRVVGLVRDGGILLNRTTGGQGVSGLRHSDETRQKIRENKKAYYVKPAAREKISAATKVAMADPRVRDKVSVAQRLRFGDPAERSKAALRNVGRKQSAETKLKRAAALRGSKRTPEQRAKMSAWQIGRVMSQEARAKMSVAAKKRCSTPGARAKLGHNKGKTFSPEIRSKVSAAVKLWWSRRKGDAPWLATP